MSSQEFAEDSCVLSEVCGSICSSQTPHTSPATCCDVLLAKYDSRECVLVQLSAIRSLYSNCAGGELANDTSTEFVTFSHDVVKYLSQKSSLLYRFLSDCLENADQYVCFCASKALVAMFFHSGVQAYMITDILTKLQNQTCTHGGVYCLQTIRELLKSLRKRMNRTDYTRGQLVLTTVGCVHSVPWDHCWQSTLEVLVGEGVTVGQRQTFRLTVGEFLSLTVELLRCRKLESSSVITSSLSQCVLTNLSKILSLIKHCGDVFVLKRFVDIVLKCEQGTTSLELVQHITSALKAMLDTSICKRTLVCWIEENVMRLLLESSFSLQTKNNDKLPVHHQDKQNDLADVLIRKTILLLMKCATGLLSCGISQKKLQMTTSTGSGDLIPSSHDTLSGIVSGMSELLLSCASLSGRPDISSQDCTSAFYQIVSEEDGCLVDVLKASTSILRHTTSSASLPCIHGLKTMLSVVNAHSLWLCFLLNTGVDHSVLLDLLLSPEIEFSLALQDYLTLVASDWENFKKICSNFDQLMHCTATLGHAPGDCGTVKTRASSRQDSTGLAMLGKDSVLVAKPLQLEQDEERTKKQEPMNSLVDYSSSSSSEDQTLGNDSKQDAPDTSSLEAFVTSTSESFNPTGLTSPDPLVSAGLAADDSDQETVSDLSLSVASSELESVLSRVMSCLIQLRISLEKLTSSGLLQPYAAGRQLVTAIESVEELYET